MKSDNIFISLNPYRRISRLAIGDFDTCRSMRGILSANTIIGTPSFIAPEVLNAKQGGGYSYKADGLFFKFLPFFFLFFKFLKI